MYTHEINTYAIGDTHFFHENILMFERTQFETLEEMHEHIITEWNKVVQPKDTVFHLGDVAFKLGSKKEEIKAIIERLNGRKVLLLGNHDREKCNKQPQYYFDIGFVEIYGKMAYIGNIILTHEPMGDVPMGCINYHGHLHTATIEEGKH